MKPKNFALSLIMILCFVLACTAFSVPAKAETAAGEEDSFMQLMPHVTRQMQDPSYWIDKADRPDEIIMDETQIRDFNRRIRTKKAEIRKFLKFTGKNREEKISRKDLIKWIEETEIPKETSYVSGEETDEAYWKKVIENENKDAVKEKNSIRYGFFVYRASMKGFPTEDIIYTGDRFSFYDENQLSSILLGEPAIAVHTSKDGKWLFVLTRACAGWVPADSMAFAGDYESWLPDYEPEDFLVVTEDEINLEYDPHDREVSELQLTMGCRLPLAKISEMPQTKEGRQAYGNYLVRIPCANKEGKLIWKYAFVPVSRGVHKGYPDLTIRNIMTIAFDALGNRYGWGGMYQARDCSLYIMELYRCFGIILPRNTTGLIEMLSETVDTEDMTDSDKEDALYEAPAGSVICMQGHAAIYLGKVKDRYYVISSSAAPIPEGEEEAVDLQSVVVNDMETKRKDGQSWLTHMLAIKIFDRPE